MATQEVTRPPAPAHDVMPIHGIDDAAALQGVVVFQAGTAERDGQLVVSGGRVLNVVGIGSTLAEARERAYRGAAVITFEGKTFRRDIAGTGGEQPPDDGADVKEFGEVAQG